MLQMAKQTGSGLKPVWHLMVTGSVPEASCWE